MAFRIGADALIPPVFRTCAALGHPSVCDASLRQSIATSAEHESPFLM
jgi:hypothetical protein